MKFREHRSLGILFLLVFAAIPLYARTATLHVVEDTYISCYPIGERNPRLKNSEQGANGGANKRLKIKKNENFPMLKFDFRKIPADATITEATLVVYLMDNKKLNHVGYCSFHVPCDFGKGKWNDGEPPEPKPNLDHKWACFIGPYGIDSRWREYPESDFTHVIFGNGGNATGVSRAKVGQGGKTEIPIDPYVVHAMRQDGGVLIINDETGIFRKDLDNQFIYSLEGSRSKAAYLKIKYKSQKTDSKAPAFDGTLSAEPGPVSGSIIIHLPKAGDDGTEGYALGYDVSVDGKPVPRVLIPRPRKKWRNMIVHDLEPGKTVSIEVTAFDEAGNRTPPQTTSTSVSPRLTATLAQALPLPKVNLPSRTGKAQFTARIVDGLTLFDPQTGKPVPGQTRSNAKPDSSIRVVPAVRGEILGLQLLIVPNRSGSQIRGLRFAAKDFISTKESDKSTAIAAGNVKFYREHYLKMDKGWIADVLDPLPPSRAVDIPSQKNLKNQKLLGVFVDIVVPKSTPAGTYIGSFEVTGAGGSQLSIPLAIVVRDITLPDELSFDIEMNAYSKGKLKEFHAVHRLCHYHRTTYTVVPYGQRTPEDNQTSPILKGKGKNLHVTDWSRYDRYYGPVLTGELFKDLPRGETPVKHIYLPFQEGWPVSLEKTSPTPELWEGHTNGANKDAFEDWENKLAVGQPLIEGNFGKEWLEGVASVATDFKKHFLEKGWTRTNFQIFSNNKHYFPSGSQSLWVMDEPMHGRDYRALNFVLSYVYKFLHDPKLRIVMRADVSRPEWQGDRMDDAVGLEVISGSLNIHQRLVNDRMATTGERIFWYGGAGNVDSDPAALPVLFLNKWSQGCVGGMPVYTTFSRANWDTPDRLRVVAFDKDRNPVPTFRMKAYLRGQQDVELLNLLAEKPGFSHERVAQLAAEIVPTKPRLVRSRPDDPGQLIFDHPDAGKLAELRNRVEATLLKVSEAE